MSSIFCLLNKQESDTVFLLQEWVVGCWHAVLATDGGKGHISIPSVSALPLLFSSPEPKAQDELL